MADLTGRYRGENWSDTPPQDVESVAGMDLLVAALSDPTIFFVEDERHAHDYWKRQAQRLMTLLDSDAWAAARFGPERWADGELNDGEDGHE